MKIFFLFIDKNGKMGYNGEKRQFGRGGPRGRNCRKTGPEAPMSETQRYKFFGRAAESGDLLKLSHVLEGVGFRFFGTTFSFVCRGDAGKLKIFLDGEAHGLTVRGERVFSLALPEGAHTVRILKATSPRFGPLELDMGSIKTDGYPLPPETFPLGISFFGDSVTAGCGAAGTAREREQTVENSDATLAFPYLTAAALGADFEVLAYEGMAVRDSFPCGYAMLEEAKGALLADIAVLAFGENDMWHATSPDFPAYDIPKFIEDYADMVRLVHVRYPRAAIVCLFGMMPASATEEAARAIGEAAKRSGVSVRLLRAVPDETGGNLHPCAQAHEETARRLGNLIRSLTG